MVTKKKKSILGSLSTKVLLGGTNSSDIIERAEDVDPVLTFQKHVAKRQHSWRAIESRDFAMIQKSRVRELLPQLPNPESHICYNLYEQKWVCNTWFFPM